MGQSVEEVKTELELLFSDKFAASPYFNTYCQIGGYLSSVDNCPRQLKQLNDGHLGWRETKPVWSLAG